MKNRRFIICILVLIALVLQSGGLLFAQTSKNLSVDELFRLGIENSLRIQSSHINVEIANDKRSTAKSARLPDISAGLAGGYIGTPTIFTKGLSETKHPDVPNWMQNYNVELVQPIFSGGKIKHNIEKTALEEQIAELSLNKDKADVKLLLMSKYLDLFRLYKQKNVFNQNIDEAEHRLHDIHRMKEQGMLTSNDVIRSNLQLTNYKLALQEAEDNIIIVSQQLDIALGLDETLLLIPDTTLLSETPPVLSTYEDYLTLAYEKYPELKISQMEIKLADKNLQITRGDYLPTLGLRVANTLQRPISSTSPPLDLFMNTWNVSMVLSYKLSSLYRNKYNVASAKRIINLQKIQEDRQMQDIRMNVKSAYIKHKEALERIKALTTSVEQANENYRIVQNRYLNQLAVLTDLLDASSVRLDAELQLTTAKTNAVYTYYQLLKSIGDL